MSDMFDIRQTAFFICFESEEEAQPSIQERIIKATYVRAWWNQIPNLYILETDLPPSEFTTELNKLFLTETYLIGQLTGKYAGRLSFEKWRHLLNTSPEIIRALEISSAEETERRRKALTKDA